MLLLARVDNRGSHLTRKFSPSRRGCVTRVFNELEVHLIGDFRGRDAKADEFSLILGRFSTQILGITGTSASFDALNDVFFGATNKSSAGRDLNEAVKGRGLHGGESKQQGCEWEHVIQGVIMKNG
jgi:hypothetical protein